MKNIAATDDVLTMKTAIVKRTANETDVRRLTGMQLRRADRKAIAAGRFVVTDEGGEERLRHRSVLAIVAETA